MKSFTFGVRSHLCSQVVALQQGRTRTKHSVRSKHHRLSDGDQPGRPGRDEEQAGQGGCEEGPRVDGQDAEMGEDDENEDEH